MVFAGIVASGSSESNSSGFVSVCALGCAADGGACALGSRGVLLSSDIGFGEGTFSSGFVVDSGSGVSSTVECLPVVQGGMVRNSSNVKTRGLQHFQPGNIE